MRIRVNGIGIHYDVEGDGPWLTMSHSLACDLHMWDGQTKVLSKKFRVLRYDTRGHGQSDAPRGSYTLETLADDLKGLLERLGVRQTHFVGISMGGMIGQTFALKYPDIVRSLVLADTASRYPSDAQAVWKERICIVEENGMEAVVEPTLARWFTEPFRRENPDIMRWVGDMIRLTTVHGYVACARAIPEINLTARLKDIRCPALVIVGEDDAGTPLTMAREIHENLPRSKLVIIRSAAHLTNLEQPQQFNQALLQFLAENA